MLSAQKEEQRLEPVISRPTSGSIDRVVNSIEGLQKRLENLALDDVTNAENQANALQCCLSELQCKLNVLSNIKERIAAASKALDAISISSLDSADFEPLTKPLHLHIAPASKLIPFPRPNKAAKEKSKSVLVNTLENENERPPAKAGKQAGSLRASDDANSAQQTLSPDRPVGNLDGIAIVPLEAKEIHAPEQQPPTPLELPEAPVLTPLAASLSDKTALATLVPGTTDFAPEFEDPTSGGNSVEPNSKAIANDLFEACDTAVSSPETHPTTDFDQRLLDDLIKNYGEFTATPNLPATVEAAEAADVASSRQGAAARLATQNIRKSNLPVNKKEADFDRQVKKIIKDYGEYDLYAQQSSANFKKGVIIAFVLLGVVFSGFYFFSSPMMASSPTPSVAHIGSEGSPSTLLTQQEPVTGKIIGDTGAATSQQLNPVR